MPPNEGENQTLTTTPSRSFWPLWLLGGLILLFLVIIIILRGLCTDVWYINLLRLNDQLCNNSSSLTQNLNLRDGSIRGPEIAEGAISLDNLSPSLQASINNINNQLTNPTPGPQGPSGLNGLTGSSGATGPQGPAGPTDPCISTGSYFCQGGNNYGSLAVLGTTDNQDLQVVTSGTNNTKFDGGGNVILNVTESSGAPAISIAPTSYSNVLINQNFGASSSILGQSVGNYLVVQDSTLTDVVASQGNIINSTITGGSMINGTIQGSIVTDLVGFTGYFEGGSITSSYGLNGRFLDTAVNSSTDLLGGFNNSTIQSSSGILAQLNGSSVTSSNNSVVYLTGGSVTGSSNSLINVNGLGASFDNVDYSVVIGQSDLNVVDAFESTIIGSSNVITNISSSAVLGTGNTATDLNRVTVSGVGVDITDSHNSSLVGFGVTAIDLAWSNINSFDSTLETVGWSDLRVNSSSLTDIDHFAGYIQGGSVLNNVQEGHANISRSNITDAGGLVGLFQLANMSNVTNIYGSFGGFCDGSLPDNPPFGCNLGYNIQFDIADSDQLHGHSRWTDIYNSQNTFIQSGATDPLVFSGTVDNVDYSTIQIRDSDISNTAFSIISGDNVDIDGLTSSILIGRNVTLADLGDNDYSFLGSDSAGNINTRINSKGDDSWLNLSGGSVGVGTNTPGGAGANGNLEVTGGVRVGTLDAATATNVCIDLDGDLSACSSSERYKQNIQDLGLGLDTIMSLRAVSFDWQNNGGQDFGFIAEEVAAVNSLLATYNKEGEIQGVKYDQLTAVLTNAIQEQQGKLEDINSQLATEGLRLENLEGELKELSERMADLEKQFSDYKQQTEARIRELEQRTGTNSQLPPASTENTN